MNQSQPNIPPPTRPKYLFVLDGVERIGNRLPHPALIFLYLTVLVMVASWLLNLLGVSVMDPGTKEELAVKSLLSVEGIQYIITSMFGNFIEFKPLGLIIVFTLGIGLAERVGLFEAAIRRTLLKAPKVVITYAVLFIGIMGSVAADSAYIIVPPIAAMVFHMFGRNPIAGLAAGIAGTGCGFTANLLVSGFDAMLAGISTEAAHTINPNIVVHPVDNWYFMSASVLVLTVVGAFVTERIIEPRLGTYDGDVEVKLDDNEEDNSLINKGLRNTFISVVLFIGVIVTALYVPNSPLRGEDGSILNSPFMSGINTIILLFFILIGLTYGITTKKIRRIDDVVKKMAESINDIAPFIVLAFFIAQFIAYIQWSNLSTLTAVNGANLLESANLSGLPGVILLILVTAVSSLFITSGTALWALLAPIFVPMFMLLDFHPAFIQVAYRIADSATNMITPLNPFVAIMLGFLMKYDKKAGLGTHIALIFPYTVAFLIAWLVMIIVFAVFNIPIGPGVPMHLK
ncbi:AbgT family transporter [Domibacillus robiginosus]|uniref:AbgT family transporter n=1 Tax=Domibacillus robiginosus TaxID=1071054 RepID=UPI00067DEF97|nr:AbgT family transporter [Domibacillus robiginosus]